MLFNYLLLIVLKLIIVEHQHAVAHNHDNIISISSVLGTQLLLNTELLDQRTDNEVSKAIVWYKGINDLKPLIASRDLSVNIPQSRYHIVNRTNLLIAQTFIGDEGFYTLKIRTEPNISKQYLYHVG
jgi:hypothetical protein